MSPRRALILFSHGSPDPEWAAPFVALQDRLAATHSDVVVALAYLSPARPSFQDVVAQLAQSGVSEAVVAPIFLARGGHIKRDLPILVAEASEHYGMRMSVLPALGEVDELLDAMAAWIARAAFPG